MCLSQRWFHFLHGPFSLPWSSFRWRSWNRTMNNYVIFVNRTEDLMSYLQRKGSSSWFWMFMGMAPACAEFWWGICSLAGVPVQACSHSLARKQTWLGGVRPVPFIWKKPRSSRRIAFESMPLPWLRKLLLHLRCTSLSTSSVNLRTSSQSHFWKEHNEVTTYAWQQSCLSPQALPLSALYWRLWGAIA